MKSSLLLCVFLLILTACQDIDEKEVPTKPTTQINNMEKNNVSYQTNVQTKIDTPPIDTPLIYKSPTSLCGDSVCSKAENKCSCPQDCGRCQGFASNLTQYTCHNNECILTKVEHICGNNLCETGEEKICTIDCPNCADNNACTIDIYNTTLQGCTHKQIIPCCGNTLCESAEDTCLIDCPNLSNITLASYPYPFVNYPNFNTQIIIGSNGSAELVIAGIDIIRPLVFKQAGKGYSTQALLDTQLDTIKNKNVILIGNNCENRFTRELLLPPTNPDCHDGFKPTSGIIRLYKTGENTYALVIAGYTSKDARSAAQILSYFNSSKLTGVEKQT
ncbi:MAG: hypothetical protein AABX52_00715 [Nanoarchaeota archaeon]